jgi:hypothetical protein
MILMYSYKGEQYSKFYKSSHFDLFCNLLAKTKKKLWFTMYGDFSSIVLWRTINLGRPVIGLTSKCEAGIMFN